MREQSPVQIKRFFLKMRDSGKLKDFLVFLVFVVVSAVFWLILALNDDVQKSFDMRVVITDVPDSVTFITEPPKTVRITVKDRGMNLMRYKVSGVPFLKLNFPEYIHGDRFVISNEDLKASFHNIFEATASISSFSPDSISLLYTKNPPRDIPVKAVHDVTVAPGMVLGEVRVSPEIVKVFSISSTDTLSRVYTENVVLRDIDRNMTVEVPLVALPGRRMEPEKVSVSFIVEQLVKKEASVQVNVDKVPHGEDILFFPARVKVNYYVPINHYNDANDSIIIEASFDEAVNNKSDNVAVRVVSKASYITNIELTRDSVEYTLVNTK